ncbi:hypothetical protein [Mesorhizobium silamurunense]|uniref:hypothetical protein n=1 Tax=Mesorhizobium silamurunense TaxID=499528 RepID=UPI00177C7B22|nr:hypothetical protein [Mesorhizobium silamurunense]
MDDARAKLKDLGDRIEAAMDRHGITLAEICIRRFRWRLEERHAEGAHLLKAEIDKACFSAREMSEGLLPVQRGLARG